MGLARTRHVPVRVSLILFGCTLFGGALAGARAWGVETADRIYYGGTILTVNDRSPTAAALAIASGKILAVGGKAEVFRHKSSSTEMVDLAGHALVPGFIDPHSHFLNALQVVGWANVSAPPVGQVTSISDVVAELKRVQERDNPAPGDWIIGYGYDASTLKERRDITRDDLDPAFPDHPVMLIHVSNHGCVLNSAGFKKVGVDAGTKTPAGGVIMRKPGSEEPAGLLMENAFLPIFAALPKPSTEALLAAMKPAQEQYARAGYTTIQEGATQFGDLNLLRQAAEQKLFYLDLVAIPFFTDAARIVGQPGNDFGVYHNRLKLGAVKCIADGSPQGKTAYWSQPLATAGPVGQRPWRGEPNMTQAAIDEMYALCYRHDVRVFTHANGDAAIDMALAAHRKAAGDGKSDRRPVMIHSQFARPDQLEQFVRLGVQPSFFTNHAFFWGDVHVQNLGRDRAYFLSPMRTAERLGLRGTNHTDYTVTPLDPLFTMWTAVNRVSRSGEVIGIQERITTAEALRALTIHAAYQYGEEQSKGSLEVGKLADLVILSDNPLAVEPMHLRSVRVLTTVKEGAVVFTAP